MVNGLIGKKLGMSQTFREDGAVVRFTLVQAGPCTVTQIKSPEHDGYAAVQMGFEEVKRLNKPRQGHLSRVGGFFRYLREFGAQDISELRIGQVFDVGIFKPGDRVDITGFSKGRGFAGVVKRHHFAGGSKTHGQSDRLRAPGSIGAGTSPGRVLKGVRMAGHMGAAQVTTKNIEVIAAHPEQRALLLKGAVPGHRGSLVLVKLSTHTS